MILTVQIVPVRVRAVVKHHVLAHAVEVVQAVAPMLAKARAAECVELVVILVQNNNIFLYGTTDKT